MKRAYSVANVVRTWVVLCAVACAASSAWASDQGQAAADQVSEASYRYFLGDTAGEPGILFTHTGDNRGYGADHDPARTNIFNELQGFGLSVELDPFTYSSTTYYNVVATQTGTLYPSQIYIVGAHYDSVNNPGADDNASGVALVLEAARVLSQYDSAYTIRYMAFDREEQGLIGSGAYAAEHASDNILGMISADMVAYDTGSSSALLYGRTASNPIKASVGAATVTYGGLTYSDGGRLDGSDHASFEARGFQACLLIEGETWDNPYYHTAQDAVETPGNINYAFATKMTKSVVGWLVDQAQVDVQVDGLEFTYPYGRPQNIDPDGGTTMRVEVTGMGVETPQPGTGLLHYNDGGGWQSAPMTVVSPNVYDAVFPGGPCGTLVQYYVSAEAVSTTVYTDPSTAPADAFSTTASLGTSTVYEFTFDTNPGWTTQSQWAFGQPTGGGGQYGGPDPTSGHTGTNVYGYNLAGDYPNNLAQQHLTSGAIDCTGLYDVHLKFWRWLGVEQPAYDHAYVRVSTDGLNWTTVWQNTVEITDSAWTQMDLDISAVADDQPTVYLRWTMGTTDSGWQYCGWNIDDVAIVATDCRATAGTIESGWSCASHGSAGDLCLGLDAVNIEPRLAGVTWLEFEVTDPASSVGASVSCANNVYTGTPTVSADGSTTVTVTLAPALPEQDCCEITLTGDVEDSYQVRTLAGDMNLDGQTNSVDASQARLRFGSQADVSNATYDANADGVISAVDNAQVRLRFGAQAATCP